MVIGGWQWCDVIAWTPTATRVQRVNIDVTYVHRMVAQLKEVYVSVMIPVLHQRIREVGDPVQPPERQPVWLVKARRLPTTVLPDESIRELEKLARDWPKPPSPPSTWEEREHFIRKERQAVERCEQLLASGVYRVSGACLLVQYC